MAKSYAQLKSEIAKLEKEAAVLRDGEMTKVVAQIRESIATFGLTVEHLFGRGASALKSAVGRTLSKAPRKGTGIPKYRDPKSGKTWTGMGKPPAWISSARSRDGFLIDQSGVSAAPAKHTRSAKKSLSASIAAMESKAEKPAAKKVAAKKRVASEKAAAAKKVVPPSKTATKTRTKTARATKASKPTVSAKSRASRKSASSSAPASTAAAQETAAAAS
jgi:DNA-binding protein H-NS